MKSIVGCAQNFEFRSLSSIFQEAFDPDIRNAFAHADYVLLEKKMVIHNKCGKEKVIPLSELNILLNKGILFYKCLLDTVDEYVLSYSKMTVVEGKLKDEPTAKWQIHYDENNQSLSVSVNTPIVQIT
ncbi:MAG: hypothetical protein NTU49_00095 [Gammaproteobacteria bacterium]|nr:hypothetical protein [Gammaproteobacteria bacterium]